MKLLKENVVTIKGKDYPVKMSVRAMIEYETITGKSISAIESLKDITTVFYCAVKAGGTDISYEQFMDLIDDDMDAIGSFSDKMVEKVEKKRGAR